MTIPPQVWASIALLAYWGMFVAVFAAFKPKPVKWQHYPDWFWGGDITEGTWVKSEPPTGLAHGGFVSVRIEPSDLEESKPTSGAG